MTIALRDIPDGERVLVDANVLLYHFGEGELAGRCRDFLARVQSRAVPGCLVPTTVGEVHHRLMVLEAIRRFAAPPRSAVRWLEDHPDRVRDMDQPGRAVASILSWPVRLLPLGRDELASAAQVSRSLGLLTNDALLVAAARLHGIGIIASNDRDFERVPDLRLAVP